MFSRLRRAQFMLKWRRNSPAEMPLMTPIPAPLAIPLNRLFRAQGIFSIAFNGSQRPFTHSTRIDIINRWQGLDIYSPETPAVLLTKSFHWMAAETLCLGEVQRTVWMHLASFNSLQCLRSLRNSSWMWKHSKGSEQVEYSSVLFQTCTVRSEYSVLPLPSNLQVLRSTIFSLVVNCVSEYIPSSTSSSQDQLQQMEGGHQQTNVE